MFDSCGGWAQAHTHRSGSHAELHPSSRLHLESGGGVRLVSERQAARLLLIAQWHVPRRREVRCLKHLTRQPVLLHELHRIKVLILSRPRARLDYDAAIARPARIARHALCDQRVGVLCCVSRALCKRCAQPAAILRQELRHHQQRTTRLLLQRHLAVLGPLAGNVVVGVKGAFVLRDENDRWLPWVQAVWPHDGFAVETVESDQHLIQHLQHHELLGAIDDDVLALVAVVINRPLMLLVVEAESMQPVACRVLMDALARGCRIIKDVAQEGAIHPGHEALHRQRRLLTPLPVSCAHERLRLAVSPTQRRPDAPLILHVELQPAAERVRADLLRAGACHDRAGRELQRPSDGVPFAPQPIVVRHRIDSAQLPRGGASLEPLGLGHRLTLHKVGALEVICARDALQRCGERRWQLFDQARPLRHPLMGSGGLGCLRLLCIHPLKRRRRKRVLARHSGTRHAHLAPLLLRRVGIAAQHGASASSVTRIALGRQSLDRLAPWWAAAAWCGGSSL
eukprot:7391753-Prymnesium_polylepis.1